MQRKIEVDIEAQLLWTKTFTVTANDGETDDEAIARAFERAKEEGVSEETDWEFSDDTFDVTEARCDGEVI